MTRPGVFPFILMVCSLAPCLRADNADTPDRRERLARAAAYVQRERECQHIPGLSMAIVLDNHLVLSEGYGLANIELEAKATAATVYPIGSISKMVTAVALLQLVEADRISLDAAFRNYVPEYPDKGERITVQQLLSHQAGVRHFRKRSEYYNRQHYARLIDAIEPFREDRLVAKPGRRFFHSSYGYTLVGLVIERVSSLEYEDYVQRNIFDRLGMASSAFGNPSTIVYHRADGYTLDAKGEWRNAPFVDMSDRIPGDGLIASAPDLAKFAIALNTASILSRPMLKQMTTVQHTLDGKQTAYGLGCFVMKENGRRTIGHGGWLPTGSAFLLTIPEEKAAVIILANLSRVDLAPMSLAVMRIVLDDAHEAPVAKPEEEGITPAS